MALPTKEEKFGSRKSTSPSPDKLPATLSMQTKAVKDPANHRRAA